MLKLLDDTEAVGVVFKAAVAFHQAREHGFALVAEGRMAEVMGEGDGFGQVSVQLEGAGDVARYGGDFHRVREPGAEMIAGAVEEHLGLVFETAEGARVDDPVAVPLPRTAPLGLRLGMEAAAGRLGPDGKGSDIRHRTFNKLPGNAM